MASGNIRVGERFFEKFLRSLWTESDAFLREILSNAHAAIMRRALLDREGFAEWQIVPPKANIAVSCDRANSMIRVTDNGAGIGKETMEDVLSQLGSSLTDQFRIEKELNADSFIRQIARTN